MVRCNICEKNNDKNCSLMRKMNEVHNKNVTKNPICLPKTDYLSYQSSIFQSFLILYTIFFFTRIWFVCSNKQINNWIVLLRIMAVCLTFDYRLLINPFSFQAFHFSIIVYYARYNSYIQTYWFVWFFSSSSFHSN